MAKKLLAIFIMAVLCGAIPATDSFADCDAGYTFKITVPENVADTENRQHFSHIFPDRGTYNPDGDLQPGEWKVSYTTGDTQGTLRGIASCNADGGTFAVTTAPTSAYDNSVDANDTTRAYCWCMATDWTPVGGQPIYLSGGWLFSGGSSSSYCAIFCASLCSGALSNGAQRNYRSETFAINNIGKCVANEIAVTWQNANGDIYAKNTCTYNDTLNTPESAPAKRGHVFAGWMAQ